MWTEEKLNALLTEPSQSLIDDMNKIKGDIMVLRRQGLMENILCLNPDETLSPGQAQEIDRVQKAYPHLNDDQFIKDHIDEWKKRV